MESDKPGLLLLADDSGDKEQGSKPDAKPDRDGAETDAAKAVSSALKSGDHKALNEALKLHYKIVHSGK